MLKNLHFRYHCHTCKMVDGVGVCSVCARVCHKAHDVSYAKYGNFFCDCGAKEDNSCSALAKRSPEPQPHPSTHVASQTFASVGTSTLDSRRRTSSASPPAPLAPRDDRGRGRSTLAQQLEACAEALAHHAAGSPLVGSLLEMACLLINALKAACDRNGSVGLHSPYFL
jgi:E3 ubiquitin-protein ligase UBR4